MRVFKVVCAAVVMACIHQVGACNVLSYDGRGMLREIRSIEGVSSGPIAVAFKPEGARGEVAYSGACRVSRVSLVDLTGEDGVLRGDVREALDRFNGAKNGSVLSCDLAQPNPVWKRLATGERGQVITRTGTFSHKSGAQSVPMEGLTFHREKSVTVVFFK
jgi:hypothetical protein